MSTAGLLDLWRDALGTAITVAAPFLAVAVALGLVISIIQTATQIQEATLTFVPKVAGALIVLALAGNWLLDEIGSFAVRSFTTSATPTMTTELK